MLVLHEGAVPPDEAGRSLFLQEVRHPSTKGIAVVILGGGFWAATARSVITFFAVTTRLPVRLFSVDDDLLVEVVRRRRFNVAKAMLVVESEAAG